MARISRSPWRRIIAGHTSTGSCGHIIIPGDVIGFDPETHQTRCHVCYRNIRTRMGNARQRRMNDSMEGRQ
jgi:hypothetical protein